ncbi:MULTISPECIES: plasmid partitioning protein RepB C-terminal domain-containing protein [Sphingomonas]|uniref:plasmid partitioning protein RepB C-terminal domain-containing protein n=1 Tax=Sphingomonas TaxID=13687 RepID=UPI000DBBF39E|nr:MULTISPECIES: plasmid partitioning protein RepB C-terminal domain-containing protein [Sphingomonas]MBN3535597.1 ParB N-terminal domain-containing protein [Sphingomonas pseudosanguinis]PZU79808.1 MAG: chromosome partitioning protein ParB [Sphingomonas sp.]
MVDPVKIAFERKIIIQPIADLLPTKGLPAGVRETVKYRRIAASVAEVGLIEPLSIARQKGGGGYLLLDGHMRLDALRFLGATEAACVVADDDEAFTYNKRVNRLATIQEHYMIVRALDRGVPEEKLARALNVDVKVIRQRRHLLAGISADVAELLKDKPVGHHAFQKLRKMKPIRQLEVAELMVSANNYTVSYAKALLATSKPADLHKPDELKKATGLSAEQMARLEREMASVSEDYKELEASYGDDMLVLVVASGFIERLLSKPEIEGFLERRHPEFLENFRAIVQATSLDQSTPA